MVGGEVDAHHGAQLQVNEQQENVLDTGMSTGNHIEESEDGGPNDRRADGEKGQDMKSAHQRRADLVGDVMGLVTELLESISTTSHRAYLPEPVCVSMGQGRAVASQTS